jgi:hypothetical protein
MQKYSEALDEVMKLNISVLFHFRIVTVSEFVVSKIKCNYTYISL